MSLVTHAAFLCIKKLRVKFFLLHLSSIYAIVSIVSRYSVMNVFKIFVFNY